MNPLHPPPRVVQRYYVDPVDRIWTATASRLGLRLARSTEVYASTDGRGLLTLGAPKTLDADDCLAQLVFHEICHWVVNGAEAVATPDWGFEPMVDGFDWRELPTLRLQAWWAARHGLADVLAPTTDARAYYDRIVADPLAALPDLAGEAEVVERARQASARALGPPWSPAVPEALAATAGVRAAVASFLDPADLWSPG